MHGVRTFVYTQITTMLKIGVLGAGHLGKIHIKLLQQIDGVQLVGFYDPDDNNAQKAEEDFGAKRFSDMDDLMASVDAVDIVTPTISHFDVASRAIKSSRHVFIEKPIANTLGEARELIALAEEANVKAQVGHVERFNPAFLAVKDRELQPMFIEAHRLAMFNPRGTDVSVVLDLMIHDIDIILSMVKANVKRVSASGVAVVSKAPDIANARIEFDNGCVANITASRISMKQMRKIRLFQPNNYISIDLLEKKSEVFSLSQKEVGTEAEALEIDLGDGNVKLVHYEEPEVHAVNSIKMELELFRDAIVNDTEPPVTLMDGHNALKVAYQVLEKIEKNTIA